MNKNIKIKNNPWGDLRHFETTNPHVKNETYEFVFTPNFSGLPKKTILIFSLKEPKDRWELKIFYSKSGKIYLHIISACLQKIMIAPYIKAKRNRPIAFKLNFIGPDMYCGENKYLFLNSKIYP